MSLPQCSVCWTACVEHEHKMLSRQALWICAAISMKWWTMTMSSHDSLSIALFPAEHSPWRQIKQRKYNPHESLRQYRQIHKSWFSEIPFFNPKKQKFPQKADAFLMKNHVSSIIQLFIKVVYTKDLTGSWISGSFSHEARSTHGVNHHRSIEFITKIIPALFVHPIIAEYMQTLVLIVCGTRENPAAEA